MYLPVYVYSEHILKIGSILEFCFSTFIPTLFLFYAMLPKNLCYCVPKSGFKCEALSNVCLTVQSSFRLWMAALPQAWYRAIGNHTSDLRFLIKSES